MARLPDLRDAFAAWHAPIGELLRGATRVTVESARGSRFPWRLPAKGRGRTVLVADDAYYYYYYYYDCYHYYYHHDYHCY